MSRLQKLRSLIAGKAFDAFLVFSPENIRYLSGFTGSSGWLFISEKDAILATDFRYTEQARKEAPGFEVVQTTRELGNWFPSLVSNFSWQRLGFEADSLSYEGYNKLSEVIRKSQIKLELAPTTGMVEQLRAIKEPEEIAFITRAAEIADAALEQARKIIRPGMREKEAAWEIEKFLREQGSEGVPFEIIVASGQNTALPHARPTEKTISFNEPVLVDIGAKINGYCSDVTRTFFLGKTDETLGEIYSIVYRAQRAAIEGVESGMSASEADRLARSPIEEAGYGDAFGHGLGHGVGLATHEWPTLSPTSSDLLVDNMVFTIEPGLYLSGQGGARIEDMVILEKGRARLLTKANKEIRP